MIKFDEDGNEEKKQKKSHPVITGDGDQACGGLTPTVFRNAHGNRSRDAREKKDGQRKPENAAYVKRGSGPEKEMEMHASIDQKKRQQKKRQLTPSSQYFLPRRAGFHTISSFRCKPQMPQTFPLQNRPFSRTGLTHRQKSVFVCRKNNKKIMGDLWMTSAENTDCFSLH
jgi:hypothetical protein